MNLNGFFAAAGGLFVFTILMVSAASGVWDGVLAEAAKVPKPLARIGLGAINGMTEQGEEVERLVCQENGGGCEVVGGEQ